jgi:hypothetical protein
MVTRVKLELDTETFGRLVEAAVAEQRPADWQAEIILRRALGTWEEGRIGYDAPDTSIPPQQPTDKHKVAHATA